MENKSLLKCTIAFFLIINTSHFWEGKIGLAGMVVALILFGTFFIFGISLLYQIGKSIQERFANKERLVLVGIMSFVLMATYLKPKGLIDFDKLEGKDLLFAGRGGVANCLRVLKLKENQNFVHKSYCFGVKETRGIYEVKGDTIFFTNKKGQIIDDYCEFGVIQPKDTAHMNSLQEILFYSSGEELKSTFLFITKNELGK